jgi:hypothetical protein
MSSHNKAPSTKKLAAHAPVRQSSHVDARSMSQDSGTAASGTAVGDGGKDAGPGPKPKRHQVGEGSAAAAAAITASPTAGPARKKPAITDESVRSWLGDSERPWSAFEDANGQYRRQ